uniref:Beta-1,4 N-acetylgalactosaminyltransferase n=1 Tax=Eptatretus burgeri TaxID=7764 RepID=A0A8C4QX02_EPTBU
MQPIGKCKSFFSLAGISIIFAVALLLWRIGSSGLLSHVMDSLSYHEQSVDHHLDEQDHFNEPRQSPREDVLKLLPHGNSCTCQSKQERHLLADDKGAWNRREYEFHQYLARFSLPEHKLLVAQANFPLSYPTQGVQVHPLGTILIPGITFQKKTTDLHNVTLSCQHGTLNTAMVVDDVTTEGLGTRRLVLASRNPIAINMQMKFISYTNTHYLGDGEQVKLEYGGQIAEFLIRVQHPRLPKLYDPGTGNISELVTIITKTFLRYEKVQNLIASVRKFYTDIRIVVADDSEPWQNVTGWKVDHYKMPFGMVGGSVTGNAFQHKLKVSPETESGFCVNRLGGYYHELPGFPGCVITDVVVNFFMAKTERIRAVGFDPQLSRIAHTEFFIDGLGELQVASCNFVKIGHERNLKNYSLQKSSFLTKTDTAIPCTADRRHHGAHVPDPPCHSFVHLKATWLLPSVSLPSLGHSLSADWAGPRPERGRKKKFSVHHQWKLKYRPTKKTNKQTD